MCPLGTGYNYFLACDTAERIIFTIVTGSGSGKLCWHSRRNDGVEINRTEKSFFKKLVNDGVEVTIETNGEYYD